MTRSATSFAEAHHLPLTTGLLVVAFWSAAAVLVATVHRELDAVSVAAGAAATIAAIALVAFGYMRLCARFADAVHALGVGVAWLSLSIVTEIAVTSWLGHGWYALLGAPARPLLRNVFLFVWLFSPVMFARRESE